MLNRILLIIFVTVFILNFNEFNCEDILDLSCKTRIDCEQYKLPGHHVTCLKGKCICTDIGSNKIDCTPKKTEFNNFIGKNCPCHIQNSDCDLSRNICLCKINFTTSFDKLRCIQKIVQLNQTCEDDSQCILADSFSFCNKTENVCKCQKNFVNHNGECLSVVGLEEKCLTDNQCDSKINNSLCVDRRCICAKNYVANESKTACLPASGYGNACMITDQCKHKLGPGSECYSGSCTCDVEHYPIAEKGTTNITMCERYIDLGDHCREHSDCYQYHLEPHEQSMRCSLGECTCRYGYEPDVNNKVCFANSANATRLLDFLLLLLSSLFLSKI